MGTGTQDLELKSATRNAPGQAGNMVVRMARRDSLKGQRCRVRAEEQGNMVVLAQDLAALQSA